MTHFFYGKPVIRNQEKKKIETILEKYKKLPADNELKQKIWDELQQEKHLGNITIPFKVVLRKDPMKRFPDFVEVILDTKV